MALIGQVNAFDPDVESWTEYKERLEHYFLANDITEKKKKKSVLIAVVGAKTYKLLRNLCKPQQPGELDFEALCEVLTKHHEPRLSDTVARLKFHQRKRHPGESVAQYMAALKELTEHCNFSSLTSNPQDQMLRDQLIVGINDEHIQAKLLALEPKTGDVLSCQKVYDLAVAVEATQKEVSDMKGAPAATSVHTLAQDTENTCWRCSGKHHPANCWTKSKNCFHCNEKGHVSARCPKKRNQDRPWTPRSGQWKDKRAPTNTPSKPSSFNTTQGKPAVRGGKTQSKGHLHQVEDEEENQHKYDECDQQDDFEFKCVNYCGGNNSRVQLGSVKPYMCRLTMEGQQVEFEIDTGASFTIISGEEYHKLCKKVPSLQKRLTKDDVMLRSYTGEQLGVKGVLDVDVTQGGQVHGLPLVVVEGHGQNLLGRNWLQTLKIDWKNCVFTVQGQLACNERYVKELKEQFGGVFEEGLGTYTGGKAKIYVDAKVKPKFCKARSLPFALREATDIELDRLVANGTLTPIENSEWATPTVVVSKPCSKVRICGDFKVTVNPVAEKDTFPVPKINDLLTKLAGGKSFSKLDLSSAYQQMELDEESKKYCVINTHRGLFRYNRLPYGIKSAPGIFQREMYNLLRDVPHTVVYLDDILVTGATETEHKANLTKVVEKLSKKGLKVHFDKCEFFKPSVTYLGHKIDAEGVQVLDSKVKAIVGAPRPTDIQTLRSFLGGINFYGKFLKDLSSVLAPLYYLLRKGVRWNWRQPQEDAFKRAKGLLLSCDVLVHYDPERPLVLSCDASPYGVGAVLAHRNVDGSEQPIAFASRTLNDAERNYAHIDRESLAIVFGVKHFHDYLYGRPFTLTTDHKPIVSLFHEQRELPSMASARIQRWAITLAAYDYQIQYRSGRDNANADFLSRLPLHEETIADPLPADTILLLEHIQDSPVSAAHIRRWTAHDPIYSKVLYFIRNGWTTAADTLEFKPFYSRRNELSMEEGCILWGNRVVVPPAGQQSVLKELHEAHPGMSTMKGIARSYVWWPNLDKDIESTVERCEICQVNRNKPCVAPLHVWPYPDKPWERVHVDFAGPFMGHMFLVMIDAYSKWLEVRIMKNITALATIAELRDIFTTHGLPSMLVSDNGSQFTSYEFGEFMKRNGIVHITCAPFHPSSNGMAERAVQTLKNGLKKMRQADIKTKLSRFLFRYRCSPQSVTGTTPAELLMGRNLQGPLDLMRPNFQSRVKEKQENQKKYHDKGKSLREFSVNDEVFVENYSGRGGRWLPGIVVQVTGPVSYKIELYDHRVVKRHVDQMRSRSVPVEATAPAIPREVITQEWDEDESSDTSTSKDQQYAEQESTESVGTPQSRLPVVPKETRSGPGSFGWESPTVKEKNTLPSPCVVPSGSPGLTKTRSGRVVTRPVRLDL